MLALGRVGAGMQVGVGDVQRRLHHAIGQVGVGRDGGARFQRSRREGVGDHLAAVAQRPRAAPRRPPPDRPRVAAARLDSLGEAHGHGLAVEHHRGRADELARDGCRQIGAGRGDGGAGPASSEAETAEASRSGVNDDYLVVADLGHGQSAFVRPVAEQAERPARAGEAR